jgi:hypothetical protein
MLGKRENVEDAAYIFWSYEVDIYDPNILQEVSEMHSTNPETLLIEKDNLKNSLSKECRIVAEAILNLPEEMFLVNGKLKKTALKKILKQRLGWSNTKIKRINESLARQLLDIEYSV